MAYRARAILLRVCTDCAQLDRQDHRACLIKLSYHIDWMPRAIMALNVCAAWALRCQANPEILKGCICSMTRRNIGRSTLICAMLSRKGRCTVPWQLPVMGCIFHYAQSCTGWVG